MGCWNETCALTNVPIMNGDEVVLSRWKNNYMPCNEQDFITSLIDINVGKYNEVGGLEDLEPLTKVHNKVFMLKPAWDSVLKHVIETRDQEIANYPEYPHLSEDLNHLELIDAKIRVESLFFGDIIPTELYNKYYSFGESIPDGMFTNLVHIMYFCSKTRRYVFGLNHFSGSQATFIADHMKLNEVTRELLCR